MRSSSSQVTRRIERARARHAHARTLVLVILVLYLNYLYLVYDVRLPTYTYTTSIVSSHLVRSWCCYVSRCDLNALKRCLFATWACSMCVGCLCLSHRPTAPPLIET